MKKRKFSPGMCVVYLILIFWALTTIYPILWVILNSFKDRKKIIANSFALPLGDLFSMENYKTAFDRLNIFTAYKNSIIVSCCVAVVVILLAGMASYALVRYNLKTKKLLNTMVVAAMMFPVFATIIPVFRMEFSWGIVNTDKVSLSLLSLILPQIAGNLAFAMVVLTGYIRSLPIELEESAYLEGCNPMQIFFKIVVPLTKPSFATVGIFSFLWSYNDLFSQTFFLVSKTSGRSHDCSWRFPPGKVQTTA